MLVRQNNVCAICEKLPSLKEKVLGVDHNHTSGKVRGLLCGACNRALGLLKDNPILLRKAETYLARTSI